MTFNLVSKGIWCTKKKFHQNPPWHYGVIEKVSAVVPFCLREIMPTPRLQGYDLTPAINYITYSQVPDN